MIPARHPRTTRNLGAPVGWDPDVHGICDHLPIIDCRDDAGPFMQSIWEPSAAELAMLNGGGFVVLTVRGAAHPPVAVQAIMRDTADDGKVVPADG